MIAELLEGYEASLGKVLRQRDRLGARVRELEDEAEAVRAEIRDVIETWMMPDDARRRLLALLDD